MNGLSKASAVPGTQASSVGHAKKVIRRARITPAVNALL